MWVTLSLPAQMLTWAHTFLHHSYIANLTATEVLQTLIELISHESSYMYMPNHWNFTEWDHPYRHWVNMVYFLASP